MSDRETAEDDTKHMENTDRFSSNHTHWAHIAKST